MCKGIALIIVDPHTRSGVTVVMRVTKIQIMNMYKLSIVVFVVLLSSCDDGKVQEARINFLESEIGHLQESNSNLLSRLEDFSIISKNDSESIKESLVTLNQQYDHIEGLQAKILQKDSLNQVLVSHIKRSLIDVDEDDLDIQVKGNAVYVSLSERMLFPNGSAAINTTSYKVLEKIALVINDHAALQIIVQGHTDDMPISNKHYSDNWDLSVTRAISVVRVLEDKYEVDPHRMTAAGKGEFSPIHDNETASGRQMNRRTEIIIAPDLSQFFDLLRDPELMS